MAFQDSSADQISSGFKGYAGVFSERRKYDKTDEVIYKARVHGKMINMLSRNATKISTTELEPRILTYTEHNEVFAIINAATTGTTFEFANVDALQLQAGDLLSVVPASITTSPSLETCKVVSIGAKGGGSTSDYTYVTVERGFSPINIATAANYKIIWMGNAVAEAGDGTVPKNKEGNYEYAYLQLFEKAIGVSKDYQKSNFYGKEFYSLKSQAQRARDFLVRQINWAFYLGERRRWQDSDNQYVHQTGGLYEQIPTANKLSMSTNMSVLYWNEISSTTLFIKGNNRREKMLSCGPAFMVEVENMFMRYGYELKINERISRFYGVQVKSFNFSGGTTHFLREESFHGTGYTNVGVMWDPDYKTYMHLEGRDLMVDRNVTNPSEAWNKTQWNMYGRLGLFDAYPQADFFLYNPSAPA